MSWVHVVTWSELGLAAEGILQRFNMLVLDYLPPCVEDLLTQIWTPVWPLSAKWPRLELIW
jgi:hypothetical protein